MTVIFNILKICLISKIHPECLNLFRKQNVKRFDLLFLSVFGLLAYSFDAFFNFPQDRPEIQSLFAIYLGLFVSVTLDKPDDFGEDSKRKTYSSNFSLALITFMLSATLLFSYFLYLNFKLLSSE